MYTSFLYPLQGLLNSFFSSSELDQICRCVVLDHNNDMARSQTQWSPRSKKRNSISTDRWYIWTEFLLMFLSLLHGILQKLKSIVTPKTMNGQDSMFLMTGIYVLLPSSLAQSHALKYHIPTFILISVFSVSNFYQANSVMPCILDYCCFFQYLLL